jgi:hypothetical protein
MAKIESQNFNQEKTPMHTACESYDEAREYIDELFEKGERPIVTVKEKWFDSLKAGLRPQSSWIDGFNEIVGTFGREAYEPEGEKRVRVRVSGIDVRQIEPRFTGKDRKFQGVVILKGPIPPECIEVLFKAEL